MRPPIRLSRWFVVIGIVLGLAPSGWSDDSSWVDLTGLDAWKGSTEGWLTVGSVGLDAKNPRMLAVESGSGVIYNGPTGRGKNLVSNQTFEDVELQFEFNVPRGSNSGVKFQAVYEVQIFDSYGVKTLRGSDCGGVYPRSEEKPVYHHIDGGHPPLVNASRPPGEWQSMNIIFRAPRFDANGNKTASARITAVLNGKTVQDNLEVTTPTGNAWHDKEKTTGPILIQGDHGPVAFRNIKARSLAKPQ
jgi:hypothetical protein